jgi:hypothetical protein
MNAVNFQKYATGAHHRRRAPAEPLFRRERIFSRRAVARSTARVTKSNHGLDVA